MIGFTHRQEGQLDYYRLKFRPPLPESQPEACRFQEGDLVQIIPNYDYDNLHLGIVHCDALALLTAASGRFSRA